jgi:hypothetical protein
VTTALMNAVSPLRNQSKEVCAKIWGERNVERIVREKESQMS